MRERLADGKGPVEEEEDKGGDEEEDKHEDAARDAGFASFLQDS